jgi:hypothetical protein
VLQLCCTEWELRDGLPYGAAVPLLATIGLQLVGHTESLGGNASTNLIGPRQRRPEEHWEWQ